MEKRESRIKAIRAAKGRINVEKEKTTKEKTDAVVSAVLGDVFDLYVDRKRAQNRYMCQEILKRAIFESDFLGVAGLFRLLCTVYVAQNSSVRIF